MYFSRLRNIRHTQMEQDSSEFRAECTCTSLVRGSQLIKLLNFQWHAEKKLPRAIHIYECCCLHEHGLYYKINLCIFSPHSIHGDTQLGQLARHPKVIHHMSKHNIVIKRSRRHRPTIGESGSRCCSKERFA